MQTVRLPYNLSSVAQLAAFTALGDQTFVQTTRGQVRQAGRTGNGFNEGWSASIIKVKRTSNFFQAPQKQAAALKEQLLNHGFWFVMA